MDFKKAAEYVQSFDLKPGQSRRGTCPYCSHRGSFSMSNNNGVILWQCFRASCPAAGIKRDRLLTRSVIESILESSKEHTTVPLEAVKMFMPIESSSIGVAKLKEFNCWFSYQDGRMDVAWDGRLGRIVFLISDPEAKGTVFVDAVGKILDQNVQTKVPWQAPKRQPKYWRYGKSGLGYFVHGLQNNSTLIVVEDPFSAGTCSALSDAYALLGTSITDEMVKFISDKYTTVHIVLDPDAIRNATDIARLLRTYVRTVYVWVAQDDPKYQTKDYLQGLMYPHFGTPLSYYRELANAARNRSEDTEQTPD